MGVSGKWIRALVGLKKSEKSQSSEKDENRTAGFKFRLRRKHSVEIDADKHQYEFDPNCSPLEGDANTPPNPQPTSSLSNSPEVLDVSRGLLNDREEWATTHIQTAF